MLFRLTGVQGSVVQSLRFFCFDGSVALFLVPADCYTVS